MNRLWVGAVLLAFACVPRAGAAIVGLNDGQGPTAMNSAVAGYGSAMVAVTDFAGANGTDISGFGAALNTIAFSIDHEKRTVDGTSWFSWSHGYTGTVYWNNGAFSARYTPAANVFAVDFYAEPNPLSGSFIITATSAGGQVVSQSVAGNAGAKYFGFYTTDQTPISYVDVTSSVDWAIAEFRTATPAQQPPVPEPSTLLLLGAGGFALRLRRRRS